VRPRVFVSRLLPGLSGHGVVLADPVDTDRIRDTLRQHGFAVAEASLPAQPPDPADVLSDTARQTSLREAQAEIARALRLPETAGRNLDALVDSLRDLALWWPHDERVALLLHGAGHLVDSDLPGWHTLTDILRSASDDLWRGGMPGDRVFETVALVERHGVPTLADEEVTP